MTNKHPSREECFALLKEYKTPAHVLRHCIKVTDTALKIAHALNKKGFDLDLDLIQGAGLIHDIARVEEKHWEVGAEIAAELGYEQEAEIVRNHMFYRGNPDPDQINEMDVICLSDRMVKEDKYVGLDRRMQYIMDKFKGNPEAVERINDSIQENKKVIDRIEKIIETSIDSLMD